MRVEFLGLADGPTFETRSVETLELTFAGIPNDRHFGLTMHAGVRQTHVAKGRVIRNARQLSLLAVEELSEVAQALQVQQLRPEWLGANIVVSGQAGFTQVLPSARLVFESGAIVVIDGDNDPCTLSGAVVARECQDSALKSQFVKAAMGKRGLVGWVEAEGIIRRGEAVTMVPR